MQFTNGAVDHKSTQKVTKVFSHDSYELRHDYEDKMGATKDRPWASDPNAETRGSGTNVVGPNKQLVNDRDKLDDGANDKDDEEIEEEETQLLAFIPPSSNMSFHSLPAHPCGCTPSFFTPSPFSQAGACPMAPPPKTDTSLPRVNGASVFEVLNIFRRQWFLNRDHLISKVLSA